MSFLCVEADMENTKPCQKQCTECMVVERRERTDIPPEDFDPDPRDILYPADRSPQ